MNFVSIKEISSSDSRRGSFGNISIKDESDVKIEFDGGDDVLSDQEAMKSTKKVARKRKAPAIDESVKNQTMRMKMSKIFVEDYGPQLKYSFNMWKNNSKVLDRASIDGESTDNPLEWSVYNVCSFISKITDDKEVLLKFRDQEIDGSAFLALCQEDLVGLMNIKMGTAIKIYNRIMYLREAVMLNFMQL